MNAKRRTLLFFAICAAAVVGAMGWLTTELLNLERREAVARHQAVFQNRLRLAQVKMDRFLEELLTLEKSRPHYEYMSFYFPDEAYFKAWSAACAGDVRVPSPLMSQAEPPFCRLHFQVTHVGKTGFTISTPRLPSDLDTRNQALITGKLTQSDLSEAVTRLETLKALTTAEAIAALAPTLKADEHAPASRAAQPGKLDPRIFERLMDDAPLSARPQPYQIESQVQSKQFVNRTASNPDALDVTISVLRPVWLHPETDTPQLLLLRTVQMEGAKGVEEIVQGVWVDWPKLRDELLAGVSDLVPNAVLVPEASPSDSPERLLSIPAVLHANAPTVKVAGGVTPTRATLYVAWAGVLAALVAVGLVVRAIIDLGERRGRFVSAVTHELRTPLTTFCLYSEMLADGMVRDENAKRDYLSTLKRESQRLAKIVENVLCYARLSEVRASAHTQQVDTCELLERISPALTRRASEAGMQIVSDIDGARGAEIEVDPQTVERILMNLVDNACKYARDHSVDGLVDNRIHVIVTGMPNGVQILVADHGPGIPRSHRREIFQPFNRTRSEAHANAPGLGLGLSLARDLARELGGDLALAPMPAGFLSGTAMAFTIPANWTTTEPAISPVGRPVA